MSYTFTETNLWIMIAVLCAAAGFLAGFIAGRTERGWKARP